MLRHRILITILILIMVFMITTFLAFEESSTQWIQETLYQLEGTQWQKIITGLIIIIALILDIGLPVPSSLIAVYASTLFSFTNSAIILWLGLTAGALLGYWLGYNIKKIIPRKYINKKDIDQATTLSKKLDSIALVLMRGIPVLAETSVIAAGIIRFPLLRFIKIISLANAGIALLYAYVGSEMLEDQIILYVITASIALPALALIIKLLVDRLRLIKNAGTGYS